jgi:hypothetical protein
LEELERSASILISDALENMVRCSEVCMVWRERRSAVVKRKGL